MPEDFNEGQPTSEAVETAPNTPSDPQPQEGVQEGITETTPGGEGTETIPTEGDGEGGKQVETPDVFDFKAYKAPSDVTVSDEGLAEVLTAIKDIDFTKKSGVDEFIRRVVKMSGEGMKKAQEAERIQTENFYKEMAETLKKDPDFGIEYENNIAISKKLVEDLGGKEALDFANNARLFDTPVMARLLTKLAKERRDATLTKGTATKTVSQPTTGMDSKGIPQFDVTQSLGVNK